ncbi:unnamed protein product, partial [Staurois parvus]
MMSQIMEANPAIRNTANCATKSIHQKSVRHSKGIFNISGSYSCTSSNVVYLIQCRKCSKGSYVGKTGQ